MPASIPKVQEIGATSAPLLSASFFIGDRCKPYNDDYMMCKTESNGKGELECMKEGRKVTRCAASVYVERQWLEMRVSMLICWCSRLSDINTHCLEQFRNHWQCLENQNHQLWQCRRAERRLNACVFDKIVRLHLQLLGILANKAIQGLQKTIPDAPADETPVHLRQHQIYATHPQDEPALRRPRAFARAIAKQEKEKEAQQGSS